MNKPTQTGTYAIKYKARNGESILELIEVMFVDEELYWCYRNQSELFDMDVDWQNCFGNGSEIVQKFE